MKSPQRSTNLVIAAAGLLFMVAALTTFAVQTRGAEPAAGKPRAATATNPALAVGTQPNPHPHDAPPAETTPGSPGDMPRAADEVAGHGDRAPLTADDRQSLLVDNVFGKDERVPLYSKQYPWCTIGQTFVIGGGKGTGTLVARDLVLTAGHCVEHAGDRLTKPATFQPNYMGGSRDNFAHVTRAWWGNYGAEYHLGQDWAIAQLDRPLGDQYGWLAVRFTDCNSFPPEFSVAGYSGDWFNGNLPTIHYNGHIRRRVPNDNYIRHDCGCMSGVSGGPALRTYNGVLTIVGIAVACNTPAGQPEAHVPAYSDIYANLAIPTNAAFKQLQKILKEDVAHTKKPAVVSAALKVLNKPAGRIATQDLSIFGVGKWKSDRQLWWTGAKPGAKLELGLQSPKAGAYEVSVVLTMARDYGIVQLYLDGKKVAAPIDDYNPQVVPSKPISLGNHQLSAGQHQLTVEIVGANPKAVKSYMFGISEVLFKPSP